MNPFAVMLAPSFYALDAMAAMDAALQAWLRLLFTPPTDPTR
jgi:hypothetical protein